MGDLIQHRRTQDHKVQGPRASRAPTWAVSELRAGKGEPRVGAQSQRQPWCPQVRLLRESTMLPLWASVSPSVQRGQGTTCPATQPLGLSGLPVAVVLSPCLVPVAICHPISEPVAQGGAVFAHVLVRERRCSQLITDVVACRWQARPHWVLPGCTWGHCPPPIWPALLSPDRQTVAATFLHRLQPLLQDPPQVCGAREVPGAQGQSQGGNCSSLRGPGPSGPETWPRPHRRLRCVPALTHSRNWDSQGCGVDDVWHLKCPELT